ncbi:MAG TPA: nucleotide sugar dehydrogenase [Mariprofundaceae bacterium]|nr:nucleotide sugar dehydrogenase [Mariprofundaceae bacterium]
MNEARVGVVGLGYVGLPLALAFGRKFPTYGFDLDAGKIEAYRQGCDPTGEMEQEKFVAATMLQVSTDPAGLKGCNRIVVAVPTPIDHAHQPDLTPVVKASETVGRNLSKGTIVIFESTVYPGVTEEICVPILERESGLKCGPDFKVGYSPERINPGDRVHTLENIVKIVSGQDAESLAAVAWLYEQVIDAGVHRAASIKVAEAAKVIENTQRDVNIALINELALIFHKLGIDTMQVLEAAGTKWNFLPFRPGLVGGHCIGVDPYYLTHRAEIAGFRPEVIQAARRINDGMGRWLAEQTVVQIIRAGCKPQGARVAVLGLTFKENCADLRNTKVVDTIRELQSLGIEVSVHDPVASAEEAAYEYGLSLCDWDALHDMDAVIVAVAHEAFRKLDTATLAGICRAGAPVLDVKSILDVDKLRQAGLRLWRL